MPFVRCDTKNLEMQLIGQGVAAGSARAAIEVRNMSNRDCGLYGYAGIQLLNAYRLPRPTKVVWSTEAFFLTTPAVAEIVGLLSGTPPVLALSASLALEALSDGAGNSRMLEVRGPMMVAGDFTQANMRLEYFQKDIDLISGLSREVRCPLPLFAASAQLHLAALAQGRLAEDPACVFAVLKGMLSP